MAPILPQQSIDPALAVSKYVSSQPRSSQEDPRVLAQMKTQQAITRKPTPFTIDPQDLLKPVIPVVIKTPQQVMQPISQEIKEPMPQQVRDNLIAGNISPQELQADKPDLSQVLGELGSDLSKGATIQEIYEAYPEFADLDSKTLGELGSDIAKGATIDEIMQAYPELSGNTKQQDPDRYKNNLFAGVADYYGKDVMQSIESSDNALINNPVTKALAGVGAWGAKGLRDVTQGGGELLDKGLFKVGLGDKQYDSTVGENIYDVVQGGANTLGAVYAPVAGTAIGIAMNSLPKSGQQAVGEVIGNIGGFLSQAPGLEQWRESLPADRRQEFDNEVAGGAIALLTGLKNKGNVIKNPKLFLKENLNPVNIAKNFQDNVLNAPSDVLRGAKKVASSTSNIPGSLKQVATRDFPISRIEKDLNLTPTERARVENNGITAGQFMLEKNLAGQAKEQQINGLQKLTDDAYNGITEQGKNIVERSDSINAKKMLETMQEEMESSPIIKREMPQYIEKLKQLKEQNDYSFSEKLAIRRDFDRIIGRNIFDPKGRVSGAENEVIAKWRANLADELEIQGTENGIDIKSMNDDIRNGITIRDGLLRRLSQENKNNTFNLQDIGIGAILSAGDPVTATAIIIGKKALEKGVPGISQAIYNLNKSKYVPTNMKRGSVINTRDKSNGFSITPNTNSSRATAGVRSIIPKSEGPLVKGPDFIAGPPKTPIKIIEKGVAKKPGTTKDIVAKLDQQIRAKKEMVNTTTETLNKLKSDPSLEETHFTDRVKPGYITEQGKIQSVGYDRGKEYYTINGKDYKASDVTVFKPKEAITPIVKRFTAEQELKYDSLKKYKEQGQRKWSYLQELMDGKSFESLTPKQVDDFFEMVNKRKRDDTALNKLDTVKGGETPVKTVPKSTETKIEPKKATVDQELQNIAKKVKEKSLVKNSEFINPIDGKPHNIEKIPYDWASYTLKQKEKYMEALNAYKVNPKDKVPLAKKENGSIMDDMKTIPEDVKDTIFEYTKSGAGEKVMPISRQKEVSKVLPQLPRNTEKVYAGLTLDSDFINDNLYDGGVFESKRLLSSSTDLNTAESFADYNPKNLNKVVLEIEGGGHDVSEFSRYGKKSLQGEKEVLFPIGSKFDVEKIDDGYYKLSPKSDTPIISKDLKPLYDEAKKYKSADEFVDKMTDELAKTRKLIERPKGISDDVWKKRQELGLDDDMDARYFVKGVGTKELDRLIGGKSGRMPQLRKIREEANKS